MYFKILWQTIRMTFFGCFTGRTNRVRRQSGSGLVNGTALCLGGMDLNEASQVCSEPKMECKTEYTCSKIVKCKNVTRDTDNTRDTHSTRDQRRMRKLRLRVGYRGRLMGFHRRYLHRRRFRRLSLVRPRRSVSCWNVHTTRRVTVCCKYICNNAGNSNSGTAEILQRRFIRWG